MDLFFWGRSPTGLVGFEPTNAGVKRHIRFELISL